MEKTEEGGADKVLAQNRNGQLHLRKLRSDGWNEADRATFLDHLAATCNVQAAAEAAEKSAQSAKALRSRDHEFRASWDLALDTGYAVLEAMLLKRAQQVASQPRPPGETGADMHAPDDMTTRDAMELLDRHHRAIIRIRQGKEPGYGEKKVAAKETYMAIVERMRILKIRLDEGE